MAEMTHWTIAAFWHERLGLVVLRSEGGQLVKYRVQNATKEQANNAAYIQYVQMALDDRLREMDMRTFEPHVMLLDVECPACGALHNSVHPLGVTRIECPACRNMIRVDDDGALE